LDAKKGAALGNEVHRAKMSLVVKAHMAVDVNENGTVTSVGVIKIHFASTGALDPGIC
jgi:hypothetical protein